MRSLSQKIHSIKRVVALLCTLLAMLDCETIAFCPIRRILPVSSNFFQVQQSFIKRYVQSSNSPERFTSSISSSKKKQRNIRPLPPSAQVASIWKVVQLVGFSFMAAILVISWEDLSTNHPMKGYVSSEPFFGSTIKGMAFGRSERQRLSSDIESESIQDIPSYNEVMLRHRTKRVANWNKEITKDDVKDSVRVLQLALLHVLECERLADDYKWESLAKSLHDPIIMWKLDNACDTLNQATHFLSLESRSEIGFDFGSCAWRHCGAFADVREAIDELDHLVGVLEPFEANFVLDVAERSLRDMLAVTEDYQDTSIIVPDYKLLQRKSDIDETVENVDMDYLEALEFLKKFEDQ